MAQYRITHDARADIVDALGYTQVQFGAEARRRYQSLILTAFGSIAEQPERIGSLARDELAEGIRSLHLIYCRGKAAGGRIARPRHVVFYRLGADQVVEIVRLLHEAMEVKRHLPSRGA